MTASRRFHNQDGSGPVPFSSVFRWAVLDRVTRRRVPRPPGPPAQAVERASAEIRRAPPPGQPPRLTWLGHASWLVQLDGVSLVVDPILGTSISGVVRRLAALPIGASQLPAIDRTLITHAHRDHLDVPTVRRIGAPVIGGTGIARYLKSLAAQELTWWQSVQVGPVEVTYVPAQHWSNRGLGDTNRALWGGFVIRGSKGTIYHSGDTATFEGFREIGRRFHPIQAALLPIGAYDPEWFMRRQHMTPEDAAQAFSDLGAEHFFAMHWGTFRLTDEPLAEPVERLTREWAAKGWPLERLHVMKIGETQRLGGAT